MPENSNKKQSVCVTKLSPTVKRKLKSLITTELRRRVGGAWGRGLAILGADPRSAPATQPAVRKKTKNWFEIS